MQTNLILAGVGGQGVVTAGSFISESLSTAGKKVVMSEIHGLAQRGGAVNVEIRIGDIYGPIIPHGKVDILIGFEPIESVRATQKANRDTFILVNSEKQVPVSLSMNALEYPAAGEISRMLDPFKHVVFLDATAIAIKAGNVRTVNTVLIGAAMASSLLPISVGQLEKTLSERFEGKLYEVNETALGLGMDYAKRELGIKKTRSNS